jgi:hypothetical protein
MPQAPFTGRWMPVPVQQVFDLAQAAQPSTVLVWFSMLADAIHNKNWQTSRSHETIAKETGLSESSVWRAQARLTQAGYITPLSGGGNSRTITTYAVTPIANFNGKPTTHSDNKGSKPVGEWEL